METKIIAKGAKVTISYRVLAAGKVVDVSKSPVSFICGEGQFMPYVEEALIGAKVGETRHIVVPPQYHYGPYDPLKLVAISRERLPQGANPGEVVRLVDEFWVLRPALIREINEGYAFVDFNHPLAGKELQFEVEILGISYDEASAPSDSESPS
ncbi:peptidylprolyl isomerase [Thermosulfuriphilus ammonigenes]|uniref:Peptidyl-prolyl cis-trans isomerase n=1 Tax=Thermosulfuriphilus ammonigenes TaxID=1936021 RepID=A0A6G7PT63_9BACT|nr:FKBP-type peptidyl-prolyl cis-trans isomerase [Thermosulfuriphilus ammonigenes]MBA2849255.1 FKBP-type peptidyl-prolyl cis-trans isomerase 2 [Thermosulfuriphilus ammonigenes]QIJ70869.1 peptidylprolyl isomerase [Thermosulfuriphilus ammonigenes]